MREKLRILFLDDSMERQRAMATSAAEVGCELQIPILVERALTAAAAISLLQSTSYDLVSLDHDLGDEVFVNSEREDTGAGVARWVRDHLGLIKPQGWWMIHSLNMAGVDVMRQTLADVGIESYTAPFIWQRDRLRTAIALLAVE